MDLELRGDVALVVGAAKGIGEATAARFAAEGAHIALLDVDASVESVAEEIAQRAGVHSFAACCDMTDYDAVCEAFSKATAALGSVDHVVVAAAIGSGKFGFPFLNLEPGDWRRVFEVNVHGTVNVVHAAAPSMVARRRGTILLLSSVAGQMGSQTDPPYSASKAAVINFMQCVAKDLAPEGVRVNALAPGMVKTALNRSVWEAWNVRQAPADKQTYEEWAGRKVAEVVPLGRWQEPEDLADMAVFLASKRSRNVTGQTINVDGGYVM